MKRLRPASFGTCDREAFESESACYLTNEDDGSTNQRELTPARVACIVTGGETGAERAALTVAESLNIRTDGWAATKYTTTKGHNARELFGRYGLREMPPPPPNTTYDHRMRARAVANIEMADGTLIVALYPTPSLVQVAEYCMMGRWDVRPPDAISRHKPVLVVHATDRAAVDAIRTFVDTYNIGTLHVTGNCARGAYDAATDERVVLMLRGALAPTHMHD